MKALLKKEFYIIRKTMKGYAVMILIFGFFSAIKPDNVFALVYPVVMASLIPYSLYSMDDTSGWNAFSRTLPFSSAQIVGAKYVSLLGVLFLSWFCIVFMRMIRLRGEAGDILFVTGLFCAAALVPALFLPAAVRWGTQKTFFIAVAMIMCFIGLMLGMFLSKESGYPGDFVSSHAALSTGAAAAATALILLLSWRLSVKWYEKREF